MEIAALITAKGNSKSVPRKNLLKFSSEKWGDCFYKRPVFIKSLYSAMTSDYVDNVVLSSDSYEISVEADNFIKLYDELSNSYYFRIRPPELSKDNTPHYDVILDGLTYIENELGKELDYLVILLGNAPFVDPNDLDNAIEVVLDHPEYDSCMSVSMYNMFNPYRAFKIHPTTYKLDTIIDQSTIRSTALEGSNINEKEAFPNTYFFNGNFWICKPHVIKENNGLLPFSWLGNKVLPFVQDEGMMEIDAEWQVKLL